MKSPSDPIRPALPLQYWTGEEASQFTVGESRVIVVGEGAQALATSLVNAYRYDQMIKRLRVKDQS